MRECQGHGASSAKTVTNHYQILGSMAAPQSFTATLASSPLISPHFPFVFALHLKILYYICISTFNMSAPGAGHEFPAQEVSWQKRDVLLFANSIGIKADELHFLYVSSKAQWNTNKLA